MTHFITNDKKNSHKLFLPSTPLIINYLRKEASSPYSYADMKPLAQLTNDYGAIAVAADSKYKDLQSLFADLKKIRKISRSRADPVRDRWTTWLS